MLDELSPEQFDEWIAYRSIEPDPWERLIAIVKKGFSALCHAWDMKMEPDDFDPMAEQKSENISPEEAARQVRQAYDPGQRSA
ncbi:hypothetical protein LCGC14_1272510 [marine sediment metagenome]|uniref:Uncharacterized protein n=1 Tax=marine sediment metagenome TaxID=412755 RepID=A0A0F9NEA6_9ZZZZ